MTSLLDAPHVVAVVLDADLDLASAAQVRHRLEEAHAQRPDLLVVDLSGCGTVDLVGLRVLLEARRRTRARGARLQLRGVPSRVERVLTLTGTSDLLAA